ncbi:hypothetical protein N9M41_08140 [Rhodopirellula sp.]|nr:hypothetical protein [Rhodopirellula sp.]
MFGRSKPNCLVVADAVQRGGQLVAGKIGASRRLIMSLGGTRCGRSCGDLTDDFGGDWGQTTSDGLSYAGLIPSFSQEWNPAERSVME